MDNKEKARRKKISETLKEYFKTDKGKQHKNTLSKLQKTRMLEYNNYLKNNHDKINLI